jgi:hypothetical protein
MGKAGDAFGRYFFRLQRGFRGKWGFFRGLGNFFGKISATLSESSCA